MIAVDSSVVIDYLQGISSAATNQLQTLLERWEIALPAVVITELFSSSKHSARLVPFLNEVRILEIDEGYWERAGKNRAILKSKKLKAKTADALIAQSCIDHDVALLTRDEDFHYYAQHCGLKLALS